MAPSTTLPIFTGTVTLVLMFSSANVCRASWALTGRSSGNRGRTMVSPALIRPEYQGY